MLNHGSIPPGTILVAGMSDTNDWVPDGRMTDATIAAKHKGEAMTCLRRRPTGLIVVSPPGTATFRHVGNATVPTILAPIAIRPALVARLCVGYDSGPNQDKNTPAGFERQDRAKNYMGAITQHKECGMSIEGEAKEAAGFIKEEAFEHSKSPEGKGKVQEDRDLRNEGRLENGKPPKTTEPGTGAKE